MDDKGLDFDDFYAAGSRRLLSQVYVMTGDLGAAEDAVAEAYARAWQNWGSLQKYGSPEAWVRTVAMRTAVSSWRKARNRLLAHRREQYTDPMAPSPDADRVMLVRALQKVPARQRQALVLHFIADLPVREVAAEMQASEGTVKSWLSRGRAALKTELGESASSMHRGRGEY
ncbi:SigE family RNA polymerase sigma factor [Kineosporia succinea]|uniref:RNA polymerase sigma-70 factor (ECF subfamily) n=1 Tax=Kineosporia succinea TaxID=84632 RepID=A0ABT9P021_9ACTN|nr:SigE family RNA polymerase sigma factor [Kineosporia succinea]MDP9826026.1 RNA polymerase sigma-70 factor (ECF subfamily) [Kineosporia succinea]